jgi:PAT family beta-lactamase induction signal transducer AmpG
MGLSQHAQYRLRTKALEPRPKLLRSKFFWVAVLYFSEGFPLGVFYEIFPVYFRQQGVELQSIGALSLLGLAWTLKFLWAPAVDHYRHHRLWMASVDLAMGSVMLAFAFLAGLAPWVWAAIGVFTVLSATNDIAVDGYTIELLDRGEMGLANGIRIGAYRVGMLASGTILILSDWLAWHGAFLAGAVVLAAMAVICLRAPREAAVPAARGETLRSELSNIARSPRVLAIVLTFALGTLWLIDSATHWSGYLTHFWEAAVTIAFAALAASTFLGRASKGKGSRFEGPMFGALLELLSRKGIAPILLFVLIFKLGDASMGFMVKPFWVDRGFSATEIGLVSVNVGLGLSIAGGLAGGWYTDRAGIFRALWVLGLFQAISNLGYAGVAAVLPPGGALLADQRLLMYAASGAESFCGGLGTAAFLAFLMAIVDKRRSAAEYALLSSLFALSRSLAGWASGFGAYELGYAPYFLLTFFLSFPAYALLPWVKRMLSSVDRRRSSAW